MSGARNLKLRATWGQGPGHRGKEYHCEWVNVYQRALNEKPAFCLGELKGKVKGTGGQLPLSPPSLAPPMALMNIDDFANSVL